MTLQELARRNAICFAHDLLEAIDYRGDWGKAKDLMAPIIMRIGGSETPQPIEVPKCNKPVQLAGLSSPSPCNRLKNHDGQCDPWQNVNSVESEGGKDEWREFAHKWIGWEGRFDLCVQNFVIGGDDLADLLRRVAQVTRELTGAAFEVETEVDGAVRPSDSEIISKLREEGR